MGRTIIIKTTTMITDAQLLRLQTWLSPAFPVGAFGYSHGLETVIQARTIAAADDLGAWIAGLIEFGSGWTDAVLFTAAWRAAGEAALLADIAELAQALSPSMERRRETLGQGEAFLIAAEAWGEPPLRGAVAYSVAVGAICGDAGIPLQASLAAFLHAFAASLISVAVRLVPLGQIQGVAVIAALESLLLATAERAAVSSLDSLGAAALLSDIASMQHETLASRIFIS